MPITTLDNPGPLAVAALVTVAATALHYWRFKVPITIAAGAAALIAAILGLIGAASPALFERRLMPILFVAGLAVFALAMRFDASDRQRETRRTDIAFWLHMLAAPLIVHSLLQSIVGGYQPPDLVTSAMVIAIFLVLALVAVLIDRRAILVSGLIYAGYAFGSLISQWGITSSVTPVTILVIGAFILLLSAGWTPLRRRILSLLPEAVVDYLPGPGFPTG
jgi:hypothetical protein